jgi:catechol 2,3-dioxygenase-like lactoylglutathione lyase family enzyme
MSNEITVPLLPCADIDDMIAFYEVLGFETTYRQRRPNPYAALRREDLHLHFFEMPGFVPADSYSSCLVLTSDTGELHRAFAAGMRAAYGKVLIAGIPRMTRPRARKNYDGVSGFSVIDPGGNWIRVVQHDGAAPDPDRDPAGSGQAAPEPAASNSATPSAEATTSAGRTTSAEATTSAGAPVSRLAKALADAVVQADSRGDAGQAARILDTALARAAAGDQEPVLLVEVLVYRAEVAIVLEDPGTAAALLERARAVPLTAEDHLRAAPAWENAADLTAALPPTD